MQLQLLGVSGHDGGLKKVITGFTPAALDQLSGAIGGGGVVLDLSSLSIAVEKLAKTATSILEVTRNPRQTEADELYGRGVEALGQGWYDDALRDLGESVQIDPYSASSYYSLGLTQLCIGDSPGAFASLRDSLKYAAAGDFSVGVTAGLIAANMAEAIDSSDLAVELLEEASALGSGCPQVLEALIFRRPTDAILRQCVEWILGRAWPLPEPPTSTLGEIGLKAKRELDSSLSDLLVVAQKALDVVAKIDAYIRQRGPWPIPRLPLNPRWSDQVAHLPPSLMEFVDESEPKPVHQMVESLNDEVTTLGQEVARIEDSAEETILGRLGIGDRLSEICQQLVVTATATADLVGDAMRKAQQTVESGRHRGLSSSGGVGIRKAHQHNKELRALNEFAEQMVPVLKRDTEALRNLVSGLESDLNRACQHWVDLMPPVPKDLVKPLFSGAEPQLSAGTQHASD